MTETVVFGGGCFWCTEAVFSQLKGVVKVTPGYAGGTTSNPTYESVSTATTGHAEVVKIEFDPSQISFSQLLEVFWHVHDPTSVDRQGNDVGSQYRSIILTTTPEQLQQAEDSKAALQSSGEYDSPLVTTIAPLAMFYPAEAYHQQFWENNPNHAYCRVVINPKLRKLLSSYRDMVKPST